MRYLTVWMNSLIVDTLEWSPTQFVLQCDQWFYDGFKFFIFRTNIWMSIVYLSPCSLLFALSLDWSLNTSIDKKIIFSFYICEIVFNVSLWLKLSIFFSLVLYSLEIHSRSSKELTEKILNVDRQFFKDVLCVTLLQEGLRQYWFLGKIATHFPHFYLSRPPLKWRFLYIRHTPFYYNPRPCPPTVILINNIYSWKSRLKHMDVDIKCVFVNKIFINKTWKVFIGSPL